MKLNKTEYLFVSRWIIIIVVAYLTNRLEYPKWRNVQVSSWIENKPVKHKICCSIHTFPIIYFSENDTLAWKKHKPTLTSVSVVQWESMDRKCYLEIIKSVIRMCSLEI